MARNNELMEAAEKALAALTPWKNYDEQEANIALQLAIRNAKKQPIADIRIHVKGGNVQDVDGVPPGVRVRIIDCDGEGDEDWRVTLDKRDAAFAGQKRANVGIYEAQ